MQLRLEPPPHRGLLPGPATCYSYRSVGSAVRDVGAARRLCGVYRTPDEPPEPPPYPTRYVDGLTVTLRHTDGRLEGGELEYEEILYAAVEVGDDLDLEHFPEQIQQWLVERGDPTRDIETRKTDTYIGASAISAELIVTFLGTGAGTIALDELWQFIKRTLISKSSPRQADLDWLVQLPVEELANDLGWRVARATDRRYSDLTLVRVRQEPDEVSAVFDTSDGVRFVIRATGETHLISRVRDHVPD
jgi:hypothetical protein